MKINFSALRVIALLSLPAGSVTAQTLGSADNYDIFVTDGGTIDFADTNQLFGDVGYSSLVDVSKTENIQIFNGSLSVHSTADPVDPADVSPSGGILTGPAIDAALDQANADLQAYTSYLDGLSADATFANPDDNPFSFSTTQALTVIDFTDIKMTQVGNDFTLTGSASGTDTIIIRTSDKLEFNQSNVILNNLNPDNVIWYHTGTSNFDLHKSDSDPAFFMTFAGTVIAPNAQIVAGEVDFTGNLYGADLKLGSGFVYDGTSTIPPIPNPPGVIPEPSSSLMLLIGAGSLLLVRRRKS